MPIFQLVSNPQYARLSLRLETIASAKEIAIFSANLWLGFRCKQPPKLTKPHCQKTWYLNKRTGADVENPHVVLRAIPSLTPVLDIELMSDHDNNGNDN